MSDSHTQHISLIPRAKQWPTTTLAEVNGAHYDIKNADSVVLAQRVGNTLSGHPLWIFSYYEPDHLDPDFSHFAVFNHYGFITFHLLTETAEEIDKLAAQAVCLF